MRTSTLVKNGTSPLKDRLSLESCEAGGCSQMGDIERDYRASTGLTHVYNRVPADYVGPIPLHLHLVYTNLAGKQMVASARLAIKEKAEHLLRFLVHYWDRSERNDQTPCAENPADTELSQESREAIAILKHRIESHLSQ